MADLSTAIRDARAAEIETGIGASPKLLIFSGAKPANCGSADPAGLLATIDLPADFLTAPSNGVVSKNGTWAGTGSADGVAASWRIKDNGLTTCHMQGTAGGAGSGAEAILTNANIANGQAVSISSFAWTEDNAGS